MDLREKLGISFQHYNNIVQHSLSSAQVKALIQKKVDNLNGEQGLGLKEVKSLSDLNQSEEDEFSESRREIREEDVGRGRQESDYCTSMLRSYSLLRQKRLSLKADGGIQPPQKVRTFKHRIWKKKRYVGSDSGSLSDSEEQSSSKGNSHKSSSYIPSLISGSVDFFYQGQKSEDGDGEHPEETDDDDDEIEEIPEENSEQEEPVMTPLEGESEEEKSSDSDQD